MTHDSPPIEVAAALVFRRGRLLISRRPHGTHLPGLWEFPGGKRDGDETLEQCIARELREELGIEVEGIQCVEKIVHAYQEKTVEIHFFWCAWQCHEPQTLACAEHRWIGRSELRNFEFPPADARLLERLEREEGWWGGGRP